MPAGIITKCDKIFYRKMRQKFILKCVRYLITKYDSFITECGRYYKNAMVLIQNATAITKCDAYHKMRQ